MKLLFLFHITFNIPFGHLLSCVCFYNVTPAHTDSILIMENMVSSHQLTENVNIHIKEEILSFHGLQTQ